MAKKVTQKNNIQLKNIIQKLPIIKKYYLKNNNQFSTENYNDMVSNFYEKLKDN